jgi:hypothetical protein
VPQQLSVWPAPYTGRAAAAFGVMVYILTAEVFVCLFVWLFVCLFICLLGCLFVCLFLGCLTSFLPSFS